MFMLENGENHIKLPLNTSLFQYPIFEQTKTFVLILEIKTSGLFIYFTYIIILYFMRRFEIGKLI